MEAFEAIVTRFEPKLVRFIYGLTHNREMAEDLCQETLVSAYRALFSTPSDLKLSAWLYKIALNKVRSEKRRKQPLQVLVLPGFGSEAGDERNQPLFDLPDPSEEQGETLAKREAIMQTLQKLPDDQATALMMDVQGYNDEEIAVTLECSVAAVRQKLFRGRKAFRKFYPD
jgi:RNA polymerase sigma-70 factor (ECF subfamily)